MLRFACPACHTVSESPEDMAQAKARCNRCGQLFFLPSLEVAKATVLDERPTQTAAPGGDSGARSVHYLHHTRDNDGDVIFYFSDGSTEEGGGLAVLGSSPITALCRLRSGVVDRGGLGKTRYVLRTRNNDYLLYLTQDHAAHLARELGVALPE
jgi:hypothetical protein